MSRYLAAYGLYTDRWWQGGWTKKRITRATPNWHVIAKTWSDSQGIGHSYLKGKDSRRSKEVKGFASAYRHPWLLFRLQLFAAYEEKMISSDHADSNFSSTIFSIANCLVARNVSQGVRP